MTTTLRRRRLGVGRARAAKRLVVGRPLETHRLSHERLGKPTALAVFASDNLSSAAYATEEILRILVPAVGMLAFTLVMPLTIGMLGVLTVLVISYRQTIKAYPKAGSAYLVTRDNFGILPAQVAGIALLIDYILTVAVSVSAGTAALGAVLPFVHRWRVVVCLVFITLIALGNLRGIREAGRLFALPTYGFIVMMLTTIGVGLFRLATGSLGSVDTFHVPATHLEPLTAFLVLHAFASGGAAVTGVEAISDGVPAFRQPEWRNARTTLVWMGCILGVLFLGLSTLASKLQVAPDPHEKVTLVAQIGKAVWGPTPAGRLAFVMLQAATMLILVLAANTAFADFPRLATFHAADRYLPRQLMRHGDRLAFSNGIIVLSVAAAALIAAFGASVTRLIPLYAVGVFTSFTFSQSGMAVRHRRVRENGWKRGFAINGGGAVVSAVMALVVGYTKFSHGAWMVMAVAPVLLAALVAINRHYVRAGRALRVPERRPAGEPTRQLAVVAVDVFSDADRAAVHYAKRAGATQVHGVHVGWLSDSPGLLHRWSEAGGDTFETVPRTRSVAVDLRRIVRERRAQIGPHDVVNLVVPETASSLGVRHLLRRPQVQLLKASLLGEPRTVVTNVVHHEGWFEADTGPWRHVAVVLVSNIHNATLEAIRYARSLHADELHCVHVEFEHGESVRILRDWDLWSPGAPLEVIESPYRELTEPLVGWLRGVLGERTLVTVVLPEFVVERAWHNLLHNQTGLSLKRALLFEPSVVVTSVPYVLAGDPAERAYARSVSSKR